MTAQLSLKRVATATAAILATLTVLFVLYRLGAVVLLFIVSIIVAAALRKGVLWLENHRLPRSLAILLCFALVIGILAGTFLLLGPGLSRELKQADHTIPLYYDGLVSRWKTSPVQWQQALGSRLPNTAALFQAAAGDNPTNLGFSLLDLTSNVINLVISLVAVLTVTYYWLADQEHFERLWLALLPVQQRSVARSTWRDTETQVGAYVRSEGLQFVLTVVLLGAWFQLLGLPYGMILALYAGFAQLIPWIGIPLTVLPLAAYIFNTPPVLIVIAFGLIVGTGLLMDRVIEPRMSQGAAAHPILTIVALLMLADSSGLVGMIIALPLAATFQIVVTAAIRANALAKNPGASQESVQIQELRARIAKIHEDLPSDPDARRALDGLLGRLEDLVGKTEALVGERTVAQARERERERSRQLDRSPLFQRR